MKEYRRIDPSQLAVAESNGWTHVATESYAGGTQSSLLIERDRPEHARPDTDPEPTWMYVGGLGRDELRVLVRVLDRLRIGRERYGPLDIAGSDKDWHREALEEHLDGAIYLAMDSLRRDGSGS